MILLIICAAVILLIIGILFSGYKKAPPDTAYIISGVRKKIIIGKASVKIPFLERMDRLSLKLIAIDVKTTNAVPHRGLHQHPGGCVSQCKSFQRTGSITHD